MSFSDKKKIANARLYVGSNVNKLNKNKNQGNYKKFNSNKKLAGKNPGLVKTHLRINKRQIDAQRTTRGLQGRVREGKKKKIFSC